jgi:intracellular sulfur oxidation DsrE/DsrF family protein
MFKVTGKGLLLLLFLLFSISQSYADKVLYHIHSIDQKSYRRLIINIENLQSGMADRELEIKLLFQGKSIQLLNPSMQSRALNQRFNKLLLSGVSIEIEKENFMRNLSAIQLNPPPQLVENIFSRIVELQKQGYFYITP